MGIYWRNGWAWGRKKIKGIEYRAPLETRSKREAEAAYSRWVAKLLDAPKWSKKQTSFQDAVEQFTNDHLPTLKKSTQVRYLQSLLLLTEHFDRKTLDEIGSAQMSGFVAARRRTGVSDMTILRDLSCLSSVFSVAVDFEKAEFNPAQAFIRAQKRRNKMKTSDPRNRYLSHDEELRLLQYAHQLATNPKSIRKAEKLMIACAFALYIDTAMRAQELLEMRWPWIDFGRLEITIPAEFAKNGKERVVPLLPRAERILRVIPKNKHTELVLWRCASGKRFKDLNHTLQRYCAEVGIEDIEVHDLRRTCGCRLLQDYRMTMPEVSKWLGHSSIVTTEQVYAFLKVDNLHAAVGNIRQFEDLRPKLDAVLDDANFEISANHGTKSGTIDLHPIETTGENQVRRITHNP